MEKRIIPVFASEAEEAAWLFEHREELATNMIAALRAGRRGEGSAARIAKLRQARAAAEKQRLEGSGNESGRDTIAHPQVSSGRVQG